jgi:hypothetical protein
MSSDKSRDDLEQNKADSDSKKANTIITTNGVLIGFLVLIVSGKSLDNLGNSTAFFISKVAVVPYLMGISFACFLISLILAMCVAFEWEWKPLTDGIFGYAVGFMIFGLLFLSVFIFTVTFGYHTGLSQALSVLISVAIVFLILILKNWLYSKVRFTS